MNHLQPLLGSLELSEAFRERLESNYNRLWLSAVLLGSAGYLLGSSGAPLGLSWCSLGLLGALWAPSWSSPGPLLELSWASLRASKTETLKCSLFGCLLTRFLTAFGAPFWAPKWLDFGSHFGFRFGCVV